jgi:hypothetical protein
MAPPLGLVRVEQPRDLLREAAVAMVASYTEHLNSHCARCTAAWAALRDALEPFEALRHGQALPIEQQQALEANPQRGAIGSMQPQPGADPYYAYGIDGDV